MPQQPVLCRAIRTGIYDHKRQRPDQEFYMNAKDVYKKTKDKDGNLVLKGNWYEVCEDQPRRKANPAQKSGKINAPVPNPAPRAADPADETDETEDDSEVI